MKYQKFLIVAISYVTVGALGLYVSLYQFTLLSLSQFFGLNSTMMGLFIAIQYFAISLPPLFLGLLSVKIGKKRVLLISFGLMIAGTFIVGYLDSLISFIIAIFIIGAGLSVLEATFSAVLADEFPEKSKQHLNFSQVCFSIGAVSSPFISTLMIKSGIYFKDLYIYISVIFLIAGIAFLFVKFSNDKGVQQTQKSIFSALGYLKNRAFLFLAISIFLYVGIENTIAAFADSYFELTLKQPQMSALALAIFWGAMIPSRLLAGILKVDNKKLLVCSGCLVFAAAIGAMLITDYNTKIFFFALCGFGCGPIWPFIMNTTATKFKGFSAPALNIMMSFGGLGGAAVPFLSGIMVNFSNAKAAYYFASLMIMLMIGFYISSVRTRSIDNEN